MRPLLLLLAPLLVLALAPRASAGGEVGSPLPETTENLEGFSQTGARSLDDLLGRTLLIEAFAYWCGPCARSVPHVRELQAQLGERGFSVLAVTNEPESLTEKWVEQHGVDYAYAYDPGKKLLRSLGLPHWPYAWLVDPAGVVVWRGDPRTLTAADVAPHLEGSLTTPIFEWPKQGKKAAKALAKRQWAKALEALAQEGEWGATQARAVEGLVTARVESVKRLRESGDYRSALDLGARFADEFEDLPAAQQLESWLDEMKGDQGVQAALDAQKKIERLLSGKLTRRSIPAALEDLREIEREHPNTAAARDARRAYERLLELEREL